MAARRPQQGKHSTSSCLLELPLKQSVCPHTILLKVEPRKRGGRHLSLEELRSPVNLEAGRACMGPAARQWSSAILIARRPAARAVRAVSAATSRASASSSSSSASSPSSSAASGSSGARLISVPASHRPARSAALVYGRVEATCFDVSGKMCGL